MSEEQVRKNVKSFIAGRFLVGRPEGFLKDSESFLEKGALDSTGILELIGFLEEEFGITVEDEDMVPENLGSVDYVVAYLMRKAGMVT